MPTIAIAESSPVQTSERVPTPYPSSNPASSDSSRPGSFETTAGCDDLVEIPISSSPPTSSPGVITTPPSVEQETRNSRDADVSIVVQASLSSYKDALDHDFGALPKDCAGLPLLSADEANDTDMESSGGESWIEDYIDEGREQSDLDPAQLDFARRLNAKLLQVLELQSRIQSLPDDEDISPYSRDLRARAAGLPAGDPAEASSNSSSGSLPVPTIPLEPPGTTGVVAASISEGHYEEDGPSDDDKENSSPIRPAFSQEPRTPDLYATALVDPPAAPKKTTRHIHHRSPRADPPRLFLHPETLNVATFDANSADVSDVFTDDPSGVPETAVSGAYTQVSGLKRSSAEPDGKIPIKKRKVSAREHSSQAETTSQCNEQAAQDVLSVLLHPGKFATRRASLRKAASLTSEVSMSEPSSPAVNVKQEDEQHPLHTHLSPINESHFLLNDSIEPSKIYPPTRPVTPIPLNSRSKFKANLASQSRSPDSLPFPLPIVAPPPFVDIPRAPVNEEEVAEGRLRLMLLKEREERELDGLADLRAGVVVDGGGDGEDTDDEDEEMESDEDEEEAEVWRAVSGKDVRGGGADDVEESSMTDAVDVFEWPLHSQICIDDEFRQEVVEWILDVNPPSFPSKPSVGKHLRDQLTTSPDTRWHAVQLFNRYLVRLGTSPPSSPRSSYGELTEGSTITSEDERSNFIWDLVLGCLALSVKFHRDVLGPFFPVLSDEFLILAAHDIEYDDFEAAQREIFSVFSYCLGSVTPGAYIQELWTTLPSLQRLLSFKGALEAVNRATWEILNDTLFELSYFKFPTSLLTACALNLGIVDTLVLKSRVDALAPLQNRTERWRARRGARCECAPTRKDVQQKVKDVEADIREVLRIEKIMPAAAFAGDLPGTQLGNDGRQQSATDWKRVALLQPQNNARWLLYLHQNEKLGVYDLIAGIDSVMDDLSRPGPPSRLSPSKHTSLQLWNMYAQSRFPCVVMDILIGPDMFCESESAFKNLAYSKLILTLLSDTLNFFHNSPSSVAKTKCFAEILGKLDQFARVMWNNRHLIEIVPNASFKYPEYAEERDEMEDKDFGQSCLMAAMLLLEYRGQYIEQPASVTDTIMYLLYVWTYNTVYTESTVSLNLMVEAFFKREQDLVVFFKGYLASCHSDYPSHLAAKLCHLLRDKRTVGRQADQLCRLSNVFLIATGGLPSVRFEDGTGFVPSLMMIQCFRALLEVTEEGSRARVHREFARCAGKYNLIAIRFLHIYSKFRFK
ncbi:hypothetical protein EIP91_010190 [Steccherinum ochraceum]|uniref:Uncharacterized protein n=1 Tax=Steccherinum ochraceum TaxID=92696 RepID=A0A4R0RX54_9APHY|nr:hypothetical protein EIP91_010190 [Steccherinum ochraceum]